MNTAALILLAFAVGHSCFGGETNGNGQTPKRRRVTVAIVGEELRNPWQNGRWDVKGMIGYWHGAMESLAAAKPDLYILPEISDFHSSLTHVQKAEWARVRGNAILDAHRDFARRHSAYVVYPTYRQRDDGRYSNCAIWIDRSGNVMGYYDKYHPTVRDLGNDDFPVVPGEKAFIANTDFGRVGTMICFDVNFTDILMKYVAEQSDVMVFPSYFNGGNLRRAWAAFCGSYVVSSTVGSIAKTVIGPSGEQIMDEDSPLRSFTVEINTNFRVLHRDFNKPRIAAAMAKYGRRIGIRNPGPQGIITLLSEDDNLNIDDVIAEFEIETWAAYQQRSNDAREKSLHSPRKQKPTM